VWVQARLKAADGVDFRHAVAMPGDAGAVLSAEPAAAAQPLEAHEHTPAIASHHVPVEALQGETLREHSRKLIEDTLAAQGGNVSQAARQLGVSRGTLYRRLRGWREEDKVAPG
jgi:transcriptional regulator of acetoin/glycerol metabolism